MTETELQEERKRYFATIGNGRHYEREQELCGYNGAHKRMLRERGSAKDYKCETCPKQARDWALWHDAEDQLTWIVRGKELNYTHEPYDYMPMCRSCHTKYDLGQFEL